ncbi:mediator complex, subunit Med18 [Rhexocercosporidium sp. MPI-PUGE-AT-0058]|nr:mediator complex, subunit Med18 [Rhexocercosporidium sp. MPI-PUGE-AT-0058]
MDKVDRSKKDKPDNSKKIDLPNSHELFLTAIVANEDFETTLRILQGYCSMSPTNILTRKLTWEGPRTRTPAGIDPKLVKNQPPIKVLQWSGLSAQLARQSYIMHLLYEVDRQSFGQVESHHTPSLQGSPTLSLLDQRPGILRWNDLPEPTEITKSSNTRLADPGKTRPVNTRLMFSIENHGLCSLMKMINHRFVGEVIQESNRFVHGDVVFELTRYLQFPVSENGNSSSIRNELPDFQTLTPFDSENKWILTAFTIVTKGDDPDQVKKGMDQLVAIKDDFERCFDFKVLDRHIFDTRVKF